MIMQKVLATDRTDLSGAEKTGQTEGVADNVLNGGNIAVRVVIETGAVLAFV